MERAAYLPPSMQAALLVFVMSFTYNNCDGSNDPIDLVRLLISDTQSATPIFQDSEVTGALRINSLVFQSAQFYSGSQGANIPTSPSNILRAAALLLDSMAVDNGKLSIIKQLLDVRLDGTDPSLRLQAMAQEYRDLDDNSGAFFIIEQVNDGFSFRDRFWKTVQRNSAV